MADAGHMQVLASMCSLTAVAYRLTTIPFAEQAQRIGETSYQMVVGWARRAVREFEALPADVQDRVVFVRYATCATVVVATDC